MKYSYYILPVLLLLALFIPVARGTSITLTSTSTDTVGQHITNSNNNFTNLNNDKIELGGDIGGTTTTPRLNITGTEATGTLAYYINGVWNALAIGTANQFLVASGTDLIPKWASFDIFASSTWLKVANNLSDLASADAARGNLSLASTSAVTFASLRTTGAVNASTTLTVQGNAEFRGNVTDGTTKYATGTTMVFGVTFDGGGAAITGSASSTVKTMRWAGTITQWTVTADRSCNLNLDIWKGTGMVPLSSTSTIVGTDPPLLSSAQVGSSTALTGWTTTFSAGDIFKVKASSTPTCNAATVEMLYRRAL